MGERSQDRRESAKALFTSSKIRFLETLKNHFSTPEKCLTLGVERANVFHNDEVYTVQCALMTVAADYR